MLKLTKTYTRPDTTVSFFNHQAEVTQEARSHIHETYITTGKLISTERNTSPNQLSLVAITVWNSQADLDQFTNDPIIKSLITDLRTAYNTANGITESNLIEEI